MDTKKEFDCHLKSIKQTFLIVNYDQNVCDVAAHLGHDPSQPQVIVMCKHSEQINSKRGTEHSRQFILQASFIQSHTHLYKCFFHTKTHCLTFTNTPVDASGGSLGFSILPKESLTCRLEYPGIAPFYLQPSRAIKPCSNVFGQDTYPSQSKS